MKNAHNPPWPFVKSTGVARGFGQSGKQWTDALNCAARCWLAAFALGLQFFAASALSQEYPTRPVRIIVPVPAGGGLDVIARVVAERLTRKWGQPVLVESKPGGASIIGTDFVAKAAPDGYTLLYTSDASITSNPHLYAKLPYDPLRDLAPITQLVRPWLMVVAHPSVTANTLHELATLAKRKPGMLNYGSYGDGSQPHLLFESFNSQSGVAISHIPYKGSAPSLQAVVAGEVHLSLITVVLSRSLVKAGKLKAIAVASAQRSLAMPDVQTVSEAGFPNIDPRSWLGLFATGGSPRHVITKIHADVAALFSDPEFRKRQIVERGYDAAISASPEEFAGFIRSDLAYKAQLIKSARIRAQ